MRIGVELWHPKTYKKTKRSIEKRSIDFSHSVALNLVQSWLPLWGAEPFGPIVSNNIKTLNKSHLVVPKNPQLFDCWINPTKGLRKPGLKLSGQGAFYTGTNGSIDGLGTWDGGTTTTTTTVTVGSSVG